MRRLNGYAPSLIVLGTAMVVLFLGPVAVQHLTYTQTETRMIQATHRLESNAVLAQINQTFRDVASFVEPSVVHVSAQQPGERGITALSSGSGWIYDEAGHVVTNYHVIRDAVRIQVQLWSGELREAEVIGVDRSTDIAVLQIPAGQLHPAARGEPDEPVQQGDLVFAFGSPFDFKFSMSSGVVSGKGRSVEALGPASYENFIQVDAAINPGNSGGPLTDFRGRVIAMNTAIATGRRSGLDEGQFAGIGLAIPLSMIEPVVRQIIDTGVVEKGFLGVTVEEIDHTYAPHRSFVGEGVWVRSIDAGSPADRAGVREDDVVVAVDDTAVASVPQLRSVVSSKLPGDSTTLTIWRPGTGEEPATTVSITVRLTRLDPLRARGELPPDQSPQRIPQLGIALMASSTETLARKYQVKHHRGVIIERTVPGSPLALMIEPGTTVIEVAGRPVRDVEEFLQQLQRYDLRVGARVGVVLPDGRYRPVVLRVNRNE